MKCHACRINGYIYDPTLGRFLSPDPLIQAPENLQSFNRYSYVWNNPLTHTDPSGFKTKSKAAASEAATASTQLSENVSSTEISSQDNVGGETGAGSSEQENDYYSDGTNIQVAQYSSATENPTAPGDENIGSTAGPGDQNGYGIGTKDNFFVRGAKAYWEGVQLTYDALNRWSGKVLNTAGDILSLPDKVADAITGTDEVERFNMAVNTSFVGDDMVVGGLMAVTRGSRALKAVSGLSRYDVGSFNDLKRMSTTGDALDIHHVGQKHVMSQLIGGYNPRTAPSIAVPSNQHRLIPTFKGDFSGSARDLLANDVMNLRNYTDAPNSSLQQLIQTNNSIQVFLTEGSKMTKNDFISLLKEHAVSKAAHNVASYLEKPPGRNPDSGILQISKWFNNLSETDRSNVIKFSRDVADECFFGVCAVLDGVRVADEDTDHFEINRVTCDGKIESLKGTADFHDLC